MVGISVWKMSFVIIDAYCKKPRSHRHLRSKVDKSGAGYPPRRWGLSVVGVSVWKMFFLIIYAYCKKPRTLRHLRSKVHKKRTPGVWPPPPHRIWGLYVVDISVCKMSFVIIDGYCKKSRTHRHLRSKVHENGAPWGSPRYRDPTKIGSEY